MTTEQINRAIASALGQTYSCNTPDYATDLNAMHKVEKTLLEDHKDNWWESALCKDYEIELVRNAPLFFSSLHATARQRAEAFLRVKGLWEDKQ